MHNSKLNKSITKLKQLISAHYPSALYSLRHGEDPEGIYLIVTVEAKNTDDVADVFIDELLRLQIKEKLPLYVIPVRPLDYAKKLINPKLPSKKLSPNLPEFMLS